MAIEMKQWMKQAAAALLVLTLVLPVHGQGDALLELVNQQIAMSPYLYANQGIAGDDGDSGVVMGPDADQWYYFTVESNSSYCDDPNRVTFTNQPTGEVLTISPVTDGRMMLLIAEKNVGENGKQDMCFKGSMMTDMYAFSSAIEGVGEQYAAFNGKKAIGVTSTETSKLNGMGEMYWRFSPRATTAAAPIATTAAPIATTAAPIATTAAPIATTAAPIATTAAPIATTAAPIATTAAPIATTQGGDSIYHPSVECQSSAVIVTVDTLQVPNVDNVDMYAGDGNATSCQATMNGTNVNFSFGLEECNPDISMPDNDTVQFTYHIQHDNDTTVGEISRKHVTGIDVWCRYPRHGVVDVSYTANMTFARYIGGASGTFTFTLSLYSDNTFATAYSSNAVIPVGTAVYADVKFENPSSELNMFVQECFATPYENNTVYKYELIAAGGCFGSDDTFAVVEANKGSKRYSFEFETFRFTGLNSSEVYLTCNLYVCQSSEPATGQCQHPHDCSVGRRAAPAGHDVYPISFGPIKLE